MHARTRTLALVVFGILLSPEVSLGQTVAETASRWGLVGSWRLDCSQPVSRSDGELKYVVRGGKLYHDRDFGNARDSSPVMSATRKADGSLELLVKFESLNQTRQFAFIKGSDGRIRVMQNKNMTTDEYTVKDGMVVNGGPTLWAAHCR